MLRRLVLPAAVAAALLTTGTAAAHDPAVPEPPPVASTTLAEGLSTEPFRIHARDDRTFVYRELTVQPGATGGWHTHDGEQVAVILSGTLTRFGPDCEPHVYEEGDAMVEPADPRDVHIGINLGDEPLVLYVVDLLPEGGSAAVPAENPGCPSLPD